MKSDTIAWIFDLQKNSKELKPVYKLHRKAVNPSNLKRMRFKYS